MAILQVLGLPCDPHQLCNPATLNVGVCIGPGDQQVANVEHEREVVALHLDEAGQPARCFGACVEFPERRFESYPDRDEPARRYPVGAVLVFLDLLDREPETFSQGLLRKTQPQPLLAHPSRHIEIDQACSPVSSLHPTPQNRATQQPWNI